MVTLYYLKFYVHHDIINKKNCVHKRGDNPREDKQKKNTNYETEKGTHKRKTKLNYYN